MKNILLMTIIQNRKNSFHCHSCLLFIKFPKRNLMVKLIYNLTKIQLFYQITRHLLKAHSQYKIYIRLESIQIFSLY